MLLYEFLTSQTFFSKYLYDKKSCILQKKHRIIGRLFHQFVNCNLCSDISGVPMGMIGNIIMGNKLDIILIQYRYKQAKI